MRPTSLRRCSNVLAGTLKRLNHRICWGSVVTYKLQHCKKNCRKLVFWVFSEQLLHHIIFWRLHFYFSWRTCSKSREKNLGRFESLIFAVKLLVNSAVACIVTLCFEHAQKFHISYLTNHLRYYMITDYCWSC